MLRRLFSSSCCRCVACRCELGRGLSLLRCPACSRLQPAPPTTPDSNRCCPDYFRLFDLPAHFSLSSPQLKASFLKLQGTVHPDRVGGAGEEGAWSAWINRANETLKNPLSRAIYLIDRLERSGESDRESESDRVSSGERVGNRESGKVGDTERIDTGTSTSNDTTTTIAHVLEVRERLDSCTLADEIVALKEENDTRIAAVIERLKRALDEARDLEAARRLVNELRYLQSIDQAIKERM